MKILFFTPTYNNINTCNAVVRSIRNKYDNEILIFDDGSEPRFRLKEKLKNITIKRNFKNAGKGNVILQGFKYAKENDYSHIITIDSDMQHDPVYLKDFIDAPVKYDIVYGRRYFNKDMPYSRIISNWITSKIISYISKCKIYDSQCGFRRYNISFIENIDLIENGYQFESEILLKSKIDTNKITFINISTIYNKKSISFINKRLDTLKFINLIYRNLLIRNVK